MRTPAFWASLNLFSTLLSPLSALYGLGRALRPRVSPKLLPLPVICVGNATAGGAGKTPVALAIGRYAKAQGVNAFFLSRGYGGRLSGPVRVGDQAARDVGDEPLLLARELPTIIARNRVTGAQEALAQGARAIIMDDGFQNDSLAKTLSLLVIDSGAGFGNGLMLPAGPLREPVSRALARADAFVVIGRGACVPALPEGKPVLTAQLVPDATARNLAGKRVFAFCGIGRPGKFWETLEALGAEIAGRKSFGDHYAYTAKDIHTLTAQAAKAHALLVTTEKDAARLPADLRARVTPVAVELVFDDPELFARLLEEALP